MYMAEQDIAVDRDILDLYQSGQEEQAFKLFINQYQARLYSLAYRLLGNHDDAMDALQEILLQLHRSLKNFKGQSGLYTWVYRLSSNVCLNFRRKMRKPGGQLEWTENLQQAVLPVERPNEDPDTMCETKYSQFLIQQAVLKLPDSQRVPVVLHDLEGLSLAEIAAVLDSNPNAIKARLQRGRAALRRIISKGFVVKGMEGVGVFTVGHTGKLM